MDAFEFARAKGIKTIRLGIHQAKLHSGLIEWTCTLDELEAFAAVAKAKAAKVEEAARLAGWMEQGARQGAAETGQELTPGLLTLAALMIALREVSDVRRAYLAVPVLLAGLVLLAWEPARALPTRDDGSR